MRNVNYIGYVPNHLRNHSQIYTQQNIYKDVSTTLPYPGGTDRYTDTLPNFNSASLSAYYPFDGDLNDYSGNNYHWIRNLQFAGNIPRFISGMRGKSLLLHNCQYTLPHNTDFIFGTGNFTVMFWMHVNNSFLWGMGGASSSGKTNGFLSKRTNDSDPGWEVYNNGSATQTNRMNFRITGTDIFSATTIQDNTWMHWAIVRTGTGANQTIMYLNGVSDKTGTFSTNITSTSYTSLGKSIFYGKQCPGTSVQHLIIAKRDFSQQEILDFIAQTKK